jgi:hypothetical protein
MNTRISEPPPCGLIISLLHWATLRGSYAPLDSHLPSLSCALRRHVQRWVIPGKRHRGGVSRARVRDQSARRVQPLNYAGWCLDLMVTPFTGLDEKLEAKRQDDALPNGVSSVCP